MRMTAIASDRQQSFVLPSPLGDLEITMHGDALTGLCYLPGRSVTRRGGKPSTRAARNVASQLRRYFDDPRRCFDLELAPQGTSFQRRVWRLLSRIPLGRTLTYGEAARRLDSGARAVGGACRSNPVPIVIPCHRVIAANAVGGYCGNMRGRMLHAKRWLLEHEQVQL